MVSQSNSSHDPCHMDELFDALDELGLSPRVWEDEYAQRQQRLIVPLIDQGENILLVSAEDPELESYFHETALDWPHKAFLYIATNMEEGTGCQVGIIGRDGKSGKNYHPSPWEEVNSLEEAVNAFMNIWNLRDEWMNAFIGRIA